MLTLLAQTTDPSAVDIGAAIFAGVVYLAILLLIVASLWKMFQKAGRPSWYAVVPIYNTYVLVKIAGRPGWWLVLFFIPIVSVVISIIVFIDLAKAFGRGAGFGVLMFLFPFIGMPMLGFGEAKYQGTANRHDTISS